MRSCTACRGGTVSVHLNFGHSPLANEYPETRETEETFWPIRIGMCSVCKLVQMMDIVPDEELFSGNYAFYTGTSKVNHWYWDKYAESVMTRFLPSSVLEVACNDGTLISRFPDTVKRVGIDPAGGPLALVPEGVATMQAPFGVTSAKDLVSEHGQFQLVLANNVLAHVSDLNDFVAGLGDVLAPSGVAVIEVQYLADLIAGNQFDHFYHEHRSFFSLRALLRLLGRHGMWIFDMIHTPAQGGSIRVFATKDRDVEISNQVNALVREESWLDNEQSLITMQGRVDHVVGSLLEMLDELRGQDKIIAGYGSTAKSCTLLNYAGIDHGVLNWMQDTTPWKIGRYTPGTGIKVLSPSQEPTRPDVYLLTAWNYLPQILRKETMYTAAGGQFLVPLPRPVIL
jgi:SAM-dependent methyltransferase